MDCRDRWRIGGPAPLLIDLFPVYMLVKGDANHEAVGTGQAHKLSQGACAGDHLHARPVRRSNRCHCRLKLGSADSIRKVHRGYDGLTSRLDLLIAHQIWRKPAEIAIDVKYGNDRNADTFFLQTYKDMAWLWSVGRPFWIGSASQDRPAPCNRPSRSGKPVEGRQLRFHRRCRHPPRHRPSPRRRWLRGTPLRACPPHNCAAGTPANDRSFRSYRQAYDLLKMEKPGAMAGPRIDRWSSDGLFRRFEMFALVLVGISGRLPGIHLFGQERR